MIKQKITRMDIFVIALIFIAWLSRPAAILGWPFTSELGLLRGFIVAGICFGWVIFRKPQSCSAGESTLHDFGGCTHGVLDRCANGKIRYCREQILASLAVVFVLCSTDSDSVAQRLHVRIAM